MGSAVRVLRSCTNDNVNKSTILEEINSINNDSLSSTYKDIISFIEEESIASDSKYDSSLDSILPEIIFDLLLVNNKVRQVV